MLFVNDEGTESGGLLQGGAVGRDGHAHAALSLTFDRFRQDQTLQLLQYEEGGRSFAGVIVNDRPDHRTFPIAQVMELMERAGRLPEAEREALLEKHRQMGHFGFQRGYLGTTEDRDATLALRDGQGRVRLRLRVTEEGDPEIQILDEAGKILRTIGAGQ